MTTSTQPHAGSSREGTPDLCGRTLADFLVLRKLGEGGMGQVYLAEQVSLKRKVALKILRPDMATEAKAKALSRFRREAEAVAQATHANIVQVYAFGEADGMPTWPSSTSRAATSASSSPRRGRRSCPSR